MSARGPEPQQSGPAFGRRRVRLTDVLRLLMAWAISALALGVAIDVLPGLSATSTWSVVAAAAVTGIVGMLVRPLLVEIAARLGWLVVGLLALAGQAVVMQLVLTVVPGVETDSFWSTVLASWVASLVGTVISWLTSSGTPEQFAATLVRASRRHPAPPDPETDGAVFIQLDGVSFPVMHWALQAGVMPTLRRWVDRGSHGLREWTVQLPCTTPASQQGILHGTCARVPAFRWYDRELGRVLVANRPADAAIIEQRASQGQGLLADDGVSVSNLFSGDAARSSMTMSRTALRRGSPETRRAFAWFMARPDGFARSFARTVAEVCRERFQSRRQRRVDMHPRVHRGWTFAALRAVTNGLLRDLNTAIVADEMMRGTRAIYVDYVDYDEVAHHAGVARLESLSALTALDEVIAILERVADQAPRRYRFIVLSDHGQSQGEPFASRQGVDLSALCADLMNRSVTGVEENVESWGRVGSMVDDLGGSKGVTGRAARNLSDRVQDHTEAPPETTTDSVVVLGSGNLGLVYSTEPRRLLLEEIELRWPALIPGLVGHAGIGFVGCLSEHGPVVIGRDGRINLETGEILGADPLRIFPAHSSDVLRTALLGVEAPDLYVNSDVDPGTDEVSAFEELVGCHGGLGGWQDRAMLLAPADLLADGPVDIRGADQLHTVLVNMLVTLGHRASVAATPDRDTSVQDAGVQDAGVQDAGVPDTGQDAGVQDAGGV